MAAVVKPSPAALTEPEEASLYARIESEVDAELRAYAR
jgi:hypothetical protein